jgi:DNA primase
MLAERAGVTLDRDESGEDDRERLDKNALYKLNEDAAAFYHRALLESAGAQDAREYLARRRIHAETIKRFRIGYAPRGWDHVLKGARKKGYTLEQLETAGLILRREGEGKQPERCYDRFRDRLMFPICDEQNRVVGFSGRVLQADDQGAKYVNSPETPLFRKSRILYALNRARRAISDGREAIVCEGQIDVIRCHQEGLETAVASQGTAFTEEHALILKRYADSVCLAFDPDTAGEEAAVRAARVFFQVGLAVRIAALPAGEDADTLIRDRGLAAFRERLDRAQSALSFQARTLARREDFSSEAGLLRATRSLLETVACSPDPVYREKLLQEAAVLLNLSGSVLAGSMKKILARPARHDQAERAADEEEPAREKVRPREETLLCEHLAHAEDDPRVARLVEQTLPPDALTDAACRAVVRAACEAARSGRPIQEILFAASDSSGAFQRFFSGILACSPKTTGGETGHLDAVKDLVLRLWRNKIKRERDAVSGPHAAERQTQLTYDLQALKTWDGGLDIIEIEMERLERERSA